MPLDTRILITPRPPTRAWMSSVHTPVALTTCWARISSSEPDSRSTARTPVTRSPSRTRGEAGHLGAGGAPGAVAGRGAQQRDDEPGVVHLRVPVPDGAVHRGP